MPLDRGDAGAEALACRLISAVQGPHYSLAVGRKRHLCGGG